MTKIAKSDVTLCEKDALQDMLDSEKRLVGLYATTLSESASKALRKLTLTNIATVADMQYCIFSQMTARGYYKIKLAAKVDIAEAASNFKKQKKTLKSAE